MFWLCSNIFSFLPTPHCRRQLLEQELAAAEAADAFNTAAQLQHQLLRNATQQLQVRGGGQAWGGGVLLAATTALQGR